MFIVTIKHNRIKNYVLLNWIGNFSSCEDNCCIQEMRTYFSLKSPLVFLVIVTWVLKSEQIMYVPLHKSSEGFKLHSIIINILFENWLIRNQTYEIQSMQEIIKLALIFWLYNFINTDKAQ